MCQMMLNAVDFCTQGLAGECLLQESGQRRARATIAQQAQHQIDIGPLDQQIAQLAGEVGPTVRLNAT